MGKDIKDYKREVKQLKETCEILGDSGAMSDIKKSLQEISDGQYLGIKDL